MLSGCAGTTFPWDKKPVKKHHRAAKGVANPATKPEVETDTVEDASQKIMHAASGGRIANDGTEDIDTPVDAPQANN